MKYNIFALQLVINIVARSRYSQLITFFCNCDSFKTYINFYLFFLLRHAGTMICCYFFHIRQHPTAAEALNYYAQSRTLDKKGVTIPSQRRYVEYYSELLKLNRPYAEVSMNVSMTHFIHRALLMIKLLFRFVKLDYIIFPEQSVQSRTRLQRKMQR